MLFIVFLAYLYFEWWEFIWLVLYSAQLYSYCLQLPPALILLVKRWWKFIKIIILWYYTKIWSNFCLCDPKRWNGPGEGNEAGDPLIKDRSDDVTMKSTVPGHASRQADRISSLLKGWFFSNSSGLPAKQIITASTELEMMQNNTFDKTTPTTAPILLK